MKHFPNPLVYLTCSTESVLYRGRKDFKVGFPSVALKFTDFFFSFSFSFGVLRIESFHWCLGTISHQSPSCVTKVVPSPLKRKMKQRHKPCCCGLLFLYDENASQKAAALPRFPLNQPDSQPLPVFPIFILRGVYERASLKSRLAESLEAAQMGWVSFRN